MTRTYISHSLMVCGGLLAALYLWPRTASAGGAGAAPAKLPAAAPYLAAATPAAGGGAYVSTEEREVRALTEALEQGAVQEQAPGEPDWRLGVWTPAGYQGVDAWSAAGLVRAHSFGSVTQPRRFPGLQRWLTALRSRPAPTSPELRPAALFANLPASTPGSASEPGHRWPLPGDFRDVVTTHHSVYHGRIVRLLGAGAAPWPGADPQVVVPYALYLFQVLEPFKTERPVPPFLVLRWRVPDPRVPRHAGPVLPFPRLFPPRLPQVGEEFLGGFTFGTMAEHQGGQVRWRRSGQYQITSSDRGYCLIRIEQGITKPWEGEPVPEKVRPWDGSWADPGSMVGWEFIPWYGQPWSGFVAVLRWAAAGGYQRDRPQEALPWMREQLSRIIRRPGRPQR